MALSGRRFSEIVQRLYPRALASSNWDNTGLLLEASFTRSLPHPTSNISSTPDVKESTILLCIDLTTAVCDEALSIPTCSSILAYHPPIFSGLKALTLSNSQQRSILRLAAAGISVYSPHTAVDAVPGGVSDFLVSVVTAPKVGEEQVVDAEGSTVSIVEGVEKGGGSQVEGFEGAGMGRIVRYHTNRAPTLSQLITRIKTGLGLKYLQIARAIPSSHSEDTDQNGTCPDDDKRRIQSLGLCAGSGGSLLRSTKVDAILTGECSHHEVLAFVEAGVTVILCGHSNTERPFLEHMKRGLEDIIRCDLMPDIQVLVSKADRDPLQMI